MKEVSIEMGEVESEGPAKTPEQEAIRKKRRNEMPDSSRAMGSRTMRDSGGKPGQTGRGLARQGREGCGRGSRRGRAKNTEAPIRGARDRPHLKIPRSRLPAAVAWHCPPGGAGVPAMRRCGCQPGAGAEAT